MTEEQQNRENMQIKPNVDFLKEKKYTTLKFVKNNIKLNVSFFTTLYDKKIDVYKRSSDYVHLRLEAYTNKEHANYDELVNPIIKNENNQKQPKEENKGEKKKKATVREVEYIYKFNITVEANDSSFLSAEEGIHKEITNEKDDKQLKKNDLYYSRTYPAVLLNYNSLQELIKTDKNEPLYYTLGNLINWIKSYENLSSEAEKGKNESFDSSKNGKCIMKKKDNDIKVDFDKEEEEKRKIDTSKERKKKKETEEGEMNKCKLKEKLKEDEPTEKKQKEKEKEKETYTVKENVWKFDPNSDGILEQMNQFLILTYMDLKQRKCYWTTASPIITPKMEFKKKKKERERIFCYMDLDKVYIDSGKGVLNVIDILYLSKQLYTYFDYCKSSYLASHAFLLLKLKKNKILNISDEDYRTLCINKIFSDQYKYSDGEFPSKTVEQTIGKEEKKFYKIKSINELMEYLTDLKKKKKKRNIINQNFNNVILPLSCLDELKNDIKNLKNKKLKNIKKKWFCLYICVIDLNSKINALGWNFRSFLYCLSLKYQLYDYDIDVLAFRDIDIFHSKIFCRQEQNGNVVWQYPLPKSLMFSNKHNMPKQQRSITSFGGNKYFNILNISRIDYSKIDATKLQKHGIVEIGADTTTLKQNNEDTRTCSHLIKYYLNSSLFTIKIPSKKYFISCVNSNHAEKGQTNRKTSEESMKETVKEMEKKSIEKRTIFEKKVVYNILAGWKIHDPANPTKNKIKQFICILDLNRFSDMKFAQRKSLDLNIKLMNWNTSTSVRLNLLKNLKILLIGLGTLGCSVIRVLIGWGVRNFTFIDNARVSFSNPARQSLYTFDDATYNENIGEYKVVAAKNHLLQIVPDLNISTHIMDIPMPGHKHYLNTDLESTYTKLEELIKSNDVVFLLTDSKESRYFPSLIIAEQHFNASKYIRDMQNGQCEKGEQKIQNEKEDTTVTEIGSTDKEYNNHSQTQFYDDQFLHDNLNVLVKDLLTKDELNIQTDIFFKQIIKNVNNLSKLPPLGITVALGYDSCLILRHPYMYFKSACYFCNDLTSPMDSISHRTLDQKCTVTKAGISSIGSSIAVELLISLTQHPMYFYSPHTTEEHHWCPSFNKLSKTKREISGNEPFLTATPHIIKYNISNFSTTKLYSHSFDKCVCCSEKIIEVYQSDKIKFVKNVIENSRMLEEITGIHGLATLNKDDVISFD